MNSKTITLVLNEDGNHTFTCSTKLFYGMLEDYLKYASNAEVNFTERQNLAIKIAESIQDSDVLI